MAVQHDSNGSVIMDFNLHVFLELAGDYFRTTGLGSVNESVKKPFSFRRCCRVGKARPAAVARIGQESNWLTSSNSPFTSSSDRLNLPEVSEKIRRFTSLVTRYSIFSLYRRRQRLQIPPIQ
jgi:hypothetical protein